MAGNRLSPLDSQGHTSEAATFRCIEDLLEYIAALYGAKRTGPDRFAGHCSGPLHERSDRRASLSISIGRTGKIILHCFAGCSPVSILASKGLRFQNLDVGGAPPTKEQLRAAATEKDVRKRKTEAWNEIERIAAWHQRECAQRHLAVRDRLVIAPEGETGDRLAVAFHETLNRLRKAEDACERLAAQRKRVEALDQFYYARLRKLRTAKGAA